MSNLPPKVTVSVTVGYDTLPSTALITIASWTESVREGGGPGSSMHLEKLKKRARCVSHCMVTIGCPVAGDYARGTVRCGVLVKEGYRDRESQMSCGEGLRIGDRPVRCEGRMSRVGRHKNIVVLCRACREDKSVKVSSE